MLGGPADEDARWIGMCSVLAEASRRPAWNDRQSEQSRRSLRLVGARRDRVSSVSPRRSSPMPAQVTSTGYRVECAERTHDDTVLLEPLAIKGLKGERRGIA